MSGQDSLIPDDLRGVLEDVAADSRAGLFRVAPADIARRARGGAEPVSVARAGVSAAERELLEVHRTELAWLLREAFLQWFYSQPDRSTRSTHLGQRTPAGSWHRRRDRLDGSSSILQDRPSDRELLSRAFSTTAPNDGAALLEASLRLESAPNAVVYLAQERISIGAPATAALLLRSILGPGLGVLVDASAHQALAMALSDQGLREDAADLHERALVILESAAAGANAARQASLASLCVFSARSSDVLALERTIVRMGSTLEPDATTNALGTAHWADLRDRGELAVSAEAQRLLLRAREHGSRDLMEFIDALI